LVGLAWGGAILWTKGGGPKCWERGFPKREKGSRLSKEVLHAHPASGEGEKSRHTQGEKARSLGKSWCKRLKGRKISDRN